jgi:copper chaperone CopZ
MHTTVSIPGIHCPACSALIKDVSGDFPSIQTIDVNVDTKKVTIDHDENFDLQTWTDEIESLDDKYKVLPVT